MPPVAEAEELSPDARRLIQFVRLNEWGGPCGVVTVGFFWVVAPYFSWTYPVLIAGVAVNWALIRWALRLTRQERLRPAVLAIASGMWLLSLILGVTLNMAYALAAIVALMPVAITVWLAGSYMGRKALVAISGFSTVIALSGAIASISPALFPVDPAAHYAITIIAHFAVAALIGITAFTFTFSSQRLVEVLDEV